MTLSEIRALYDNHVKTGCMISPATWAEMVGELLDETDRLKVLFRVNMLRLKPGTSHEEIDRVLK